jgi:hypothetical protein
VPALIRFFFPAGLLSQFACGTQHRILLISQTDGILAKDIAIIIHRARRIGQSIGATKELLLASVSSLMAPVTATSQPSAVSPVESSRTASDLPSARFLEPEDHSKLWTHTTYIVLLVLTALWTAQAYATWGAWGNLTIDSGHEMYIPALLAQGKTLYRDVWFPYGPAAPYFNSYLFRLFGLNLNVLYWAGSLSALGSAIFLFLVGRRLSSWYVGLTAGAILLLQAFQPSIFSFPLPYSFATVYGCLIGCLFLWISIVALSNASSLWIFGAGTAAAAALLFKPEFGTACYATLALLVAVRGFSPRSRGRVVKDILAILPGIVASGLVFLWMVSIGGFEFITQENLVAWPTSYFMKAYGKMWLERNGFTVSGAAFAGALARTLPIAGVLLASYCVLWWKRSDTRATLFKAMIVLVVVLYLAKTNFFIFPPVQTAQLVLSTIFFPRDMVLYVTVAALIAWAYFWVRRKENMIRCAGIALLFTYSGLLAFRILMRMQTSDYPIFYNGPVVLSFLVLACWIVPRSGRSRRFVFWGELTICLFCLAAVALPTLRAEATARDFVPLTTERGTIRVSKHMAENYEVAIQFMKEKAAAGESVLSVPEDTSLYFLSGTYCPTRVPLFVPGVIAPGKMSEQMIQEIDRKPVRYLLWSNRIFPEFDTPVFGKDFNQEIGDYLKANYHRVGPLLPVTGSIWDWTAVVWERNSNSKSGSARGNGL